MICQKVINFPCKKCGATYKSYNWLQKHIKTKHPSPTELTQSILRSVQANNTPKKFIKIPNANRKAYIKQKISPILRYKIWEKYIGHKIEAKCFCCNINKITPFTSHHTFQAGHILAEKMGGKCVIGNMLPICRDCNKDMGIQHWDAYIKYNMLPARIFGSNIPIETHNHASRIQKCWRDRKKKKVKKRKKKKKKKRENSTYMNSTKSFENYLKSSKIYNKQASRVSKN